MRILDDDDEDHDDDDEDDQGDDDDVDDCRHAGADQIPGRRQVATCVTPSLISYIHSYFTHFTLIYSDIYMFHNILQYLTSTHISHILL